MSQVPRIYLADPEVFLPNAVEIGQRKKALRRQYGFEVLFPFDNEVVARPDERADRLVYAANLRTMRVADLGLFNLTPFRDSHADVGTAFEFAKITAWGKPAFGYTNATATMLERIPDATQDSTTAI